MEHVIRKHKGKGRRVSTEPNLLLIVGRNLCILLVRQTASAFRSALLWFVCSGSPTRNVFFSLFCDVVALARSVVVVVVVVLTLTL